MEQEFLNTQESVVVVVFHADECPTCEKASIVISKLSDSYKNRVKFVTIHIDTSTNDLVKHYNISKVPTFLIFKDKKMTSTVVGFKDELELEKKIRGFI